MSDYLISWDEKPLRSVAGLSNVRDFVISLHRELLQSDRPTLVEIGISGQFAVTIGLGFKLGSVLMFDDLKDRTVHFVTDGDGGGEDSIWWHYGNQMSEIPACTTVPIDESIEGMIDTLRAGKPSPLVHWERS